MNPFNSRLWPIVRSLLLSGVGSALLVSCSNLGYSSDASSSQQDASTSNPEALVADFSFPQDSCGEQAAQPSGNWYVVYIDGANPDEVRRKYCRDAIGTVRNKTGAPTVQVASLTDYSKALKLATAVGGEVETTATSQASPSAASPTANPNGSASNGVAATESGSLTAADPGSSINIRESASTAAAIAHTGRVGDQVRISEQRQGDDGRTWYKVSLQSGQEGWVRSDFVKQETASNAGSNHTNSSFNTGNMASSSGVSSASGSQSSNPATSGSNYSSTNNGASASAVASSPMTDRSASQYSSSSTADQYSTSASASGTSEQSAANSSDSYASDQYSSDQSSSETAADEAEDTSEATSISSGSSTTLVSDNPESRINIRDDASTSARIQHTGHDGDPVQIIDSTQGEDGYIWYQVEFESGAVGWVRGDLVSGG
jgi:uncharacterized protein YgiM (DUF1202 family)